MDLNIIWFVLIAVLYVGFFVLEGFDFGVGILVPVLSKDKDPEMVDLKRRTMINTIGPHWDGNEVWLLTAGGATFAAFPHWYATMFSGFYLAFFLLLVALILRGVAFEFRSKDENPRWRKFWDWSIFTGSLVPALLLGVAFGNLVKGVPIDQNMQYAGTFMDLLNPYALLAGITLVFGCMLYGALFLSLKTTGELRDQASALARKLWPVVLVLLLGLMAATYIATDLLNELGVNPGAVRLAGLAAIVLTGYFLQKGHQGWAFIMVATTIATTIITAFMIMFPNVMISSLNPEWSLTIYNASSSPYTLRVMSIVALIFVPIVLVYQGWSYWVFRKRLETKVEGLTY
ncbi:MAG TPA: cytochrome d ubiquinol oxidase subunit II [Anaerolineales bacterium]|nr:cytochrome d ubiquinol oxidase subunit II [Anaerolineales bacterium]